MEQRRIRDSKSEEGIALLISIFVLLLISVVAIALIVSSGTESALAGNYRSSTGVYNAAIAGLEEVRARLRPQSPISFKNTDAAFLPAGGAPLAACSPIYVTNPLGGELVTPWVPGSTYADAEFNLEFGGICPAPLPPNPSPNTPSIWNRNPLNGLPFPGPLYKWVRINGVTELSMNLDTYPYDTTKDATLVYYDGQHLTDNIGAGQQVLEVTALAVLPNGSQKLVQYLVAPVPVTLPPFMAALTLSGSSGGPNPVFQAPAENHTYAVKGDDYDCSGNPSGLPSSKAAIGIYGDYPGSTSNLIVSGMKSGIPSFPPSTAAKSNYTGQGSWPDVEYLNASQTPTELNNIVQSIIHSADAVVPAGSASTQTTYLNSLNMSPSNMLTVVANGNLDLTHWGNTGYGLLLVTGTFTMDPDNGWRGIVLVIGEGKINNTDTTGSREFDGAVFVAKTNIAGSNLGAASVQFNDEMQGNGMRYSSCWIQRAQPTSGYRILSFHEIAQ